MKRIEDVPPDKLYIWSTRLFALMNLTWDYIDTICDVCIINRIDGTKKLVREVRKLKTEYDRFRWNITGAEYEAGETETGLRFEKSFKKDFGKISNWGFSLAGSLNLEADRSELFMATQQALTLMAAVKIYARWCDKQIKSYDVWVPDCCLVQTEFMKLYPLIPQFLTHDEYSQYTTHRDQYAHILACRLHIFGKLKIVE